MFAQCDDELAGFVCWGLSKGVRHICLSHMAGRLQVELSEAGRKQSRRSSHHSGAEVSLEISTALVTPGPLRQPAYTQDCTGGFTLRICSVLGRQFFHGIL